MNYIQKKPKILIIDDSKIVRGALANFLKQEGFDDLYFAENGEEGIILLKKVSPLVVILDLQMPIMDGIKFLEKIQLKPTDPYSVVKRAIEIKKAEDMAATMTKKRINSERTLKDKEMEEKLRQADKMVSLDTIRKILQINR